MTTLSYWDILPPDIQELIQQLSGSLLIQQIFKKNRSWYFIRNNKLKMLRPNYSGKGLRCGDRVLIQYNTKLHYGTISNLKSPYKYHSIITLIDGKQLYYYKKEEKCTKEIRRLILLDPWRCCMCHLCKICDQCLFAKSNNDMVN
jgi:hypothetical protein